MKLSELKPCVSCYGKLAPVWYVLRVSQAMLNPQATRSTMGLMMHFGNLQIAEAMSPDADCVTIFGDKEPGLMTEIHVCQECFLMKLGIAALMEANRAAAVDEDEAEIAE